MRSKDNFESVNKWLYLGADRNNESFAKIGITTGDLSTRSSSPGNPNYYIFCAFKCKHDILKSELENIERKILIRFDELYPKKRLQHAESGWLSECFDNIDFFEFFLDLHYELFHNYGNNFLGCKFEDEGYIIGELLDCEFNSGMLSRNQINRYRRLLLQ